MSNETWGRLVRLLEDDAESARPLFCGANPTAGPMLEIGADRLARAFCLDGFYAWGLYECARLGLARRAARNALTGPRCRA